MSERGLIGFNPWYSEVQVERLESLGYLLDRPKSNLASDIVVQSLIEPPGPEVLQKEESEPVSQKRAFFYLEPKDGEALRRLATENQLAAGTTARRLIAHFMEDMVEKLPQIDIAVDLRKSAQERLGYVDLGTGEQE